MPSQEGGVNIHAMIRYIVLLSWFIADLFELVSARNHFGSRQCVLTVLLAGVAKNACRVLLAAVLRCQGDWPLVKSSWFLFSLTLEYNLAKRVFTPFWVIG